MSASNTDLATVGRSEIAASDQPMSMMNFIAMALENPAIDASKLKALLDMQREVMADQAKVQFNQALHAAQAAIPQVEKLGLVNLIRKDGTDGGKYAFARWEDMDKVLRPIMATNGFTLSFDMTQRPGDGGGATVTATLSHVAGHSIQRSVSLALDAGAGRNNLQAMGSTIAYSKRYLAEMLFNIVRKGADDDGKLGGTKFITEAQAQQIEALILETKSDRPRFMEHFQLASLLNMTADAATPAFNMLLSKVKPERRQVWQDAIKNGGVPA